MRIVLVTPLVLKPRSVCWILGESYVFANCRSRCTGPVRNPILVDGWWPRVGVVDVWPWNITGGLGLETSLSASSLTHRLQRINRPFPLMRHQIQQTSFEVTMLQRHWNYPVTRLPVRTSSLPYAWSRIEHVYVDEERGHIKGNTSLLQRLVLISVQNIALPKIAFTEGSQISHGTIQSLWYLRLRRKAA